MSYKRIVFVAISAMLVNYAVALPAKAKPYQPPGVQKEPAVAGYSLALKQFTPKRTGEPAAYPAPVWPGANSVDVPLQGARERQLGLDGPVQAGALPIRVQGVNGAAPGSVRVQAFDRRATLAAGVDGVLMRLSRTDGGTQAAPVRVVVDYSAFRWAYGADWASRLALYVLPSCAGCRPQKLGSVNDIKAATVTATVNVDKLTTVSTPVTGVQPGEVTSATSGGALVALAAEASGPGGDYKATSLSPSATWNAGGNSGDFGWSYTLRVPPSVGGPTPTVAFGYSSSSVDGRMASTNNQASWVGEGFEWQPGHIERRYNGCADDMGSGANNTEKTGDQCWETDNASLTLSGHAGELIKDGANGNLWHLRQDDGTRVEHKTGGPNGDDNGEWWLVTTPDGVQYWFGGRSGSNAVLTAPVYGNHPGEPCHQTAFATSFCSQGYRWQLDYVLDTNGNTMLYSYAKETNKYGRNNKPEDDTVYDRDGYLQKIEYGTRDGVSESAPVQVLFTVADRCLSSCTIKDATHWPDVPWDSECTADTCTFNQNSPSFWSTKRLSSVKTQLWGGSSYRDVEQWTLTHSFPSSDQPTLWLDKISHTGLVGGSKTVPDITFLGVAMPNRVDTFDDQFPAMNRYRMKTITSETGGVVDITYSGPDCVKGTRVPDQNALQDNVLRCYPVKWQPEGQLNPINDFFHKYLVTDVAEADLSGSSSRVISHYQYMGDPAWHYTDDDGFIKKDFKTWSVWRGYGAVRTIKGDAPEQSMEERRYFRGMHGDKTPTGTRNIVMPAIAIGNVPAVNDEDAYNGMVRETVSFDGPTGAELTARAGAPWQSAPTASRTINGQTVHARFAAEQVAYTRKLLDHGRGYQTTTQNTQLDAYGMPTRIEDLGDDGKTGDEQCTLNDYVRNTSANILDRVGRKRTFAVNCTAATGGGLTDDDVIGDTRTSYDGQAWNVAPIKGMATQVETLKAYNGGSPAYVVESRTTYDGQGRPLDQWDARGGKTTNAYTPASGGPLTASSQTSPLGWVKTSTLEPAWGLPLSTTDANGRKVDLAYDPFGRLTTVWLPGRDKATQSASVTYDYLIRNNAPTVVTTKRLNASGGYITSYQFYDNLLRSRQTQESDGAGGTAAVVTDIFYDSAGRAYKNFDPYVAKNASNQPVAPGTNLFLPTGNIPSVRLKVFDGSGRESAQVTLRDAPPASPGGTETSRTVTAYGGDRVDVTPPAGGTATSTVTNAVGKTSQIRYYHAGSVVGGDTGFDKTDYIFNRKGRLEQVNDAAGNAWKYGYDARGNQIQSIDPDKGTTNTVYNDAGDILSTTDARALTLAYTYDAAGRKTSLRDGSATGPKRAEWVYDQLTNGTFAYGYLVKTIRYEGPDQYIKEHVGYTVDYKPTSVKYTIPNNTTASGVNGAYSYVYTYAQDGSPATTRLPALGDPALGLETLTFGYNDLGKPTSLNTSLGGTYVTAPDQNTPATEYTSFGELAAIHLRHNAGTRVDILRTYETDTRRLAQIWTTRATTPTTVADVRFGYDTLGNVNKIANLTNADTQCFSVDDMKRLKEAWTPANGDCTAAPTAGALGGPARYWQTYTFDSVGNRGQLVEHATAQGDRTTTYTNPAGAHQVTGTSTVDGSGTKTGAYTYDASGNTKTRPATGAETQTLNWDAEGHLATSSDSTGTTTFVYDADGNRLLRKDPAGKTLYLPFQEVRYTPSTGTKSCTRYYTHADTVIATRTSAGVVWLGGDHHGTSQIAINAVGQAAATRLDTPYGVQRGSTGTWPSTMDKGFVGGTSDNTGLTHLGAREYDPVLGRFISVDPVIDIKDPQQIHGYTYANNGPVTLSDADGLWPKWLDKAASAVSNAVSTVSNTVVSATKAAGQWVYDNAGTISTVLTVAAIACSIIPPLQAVAPFLGAAATVVGAIDTYKSCKSGAALDCAIGVASMIPGGRALGAAEKGLKYADEAADLAKAEKLAAGGKPTKLIPCHSFDPATKVLMADGTTKAISSVKVGDKVTVKDPSTGDAGSSQVTVLHQNLDRGLADVTILARGKAEKVKTTANHPFWSVTRDAWVSAAELEPGERLYNPDGAEVTVAAVHTHPGATVMRDLTVADVHTYFIVTGDSPLLVHNTGEQCPIPGHNGEWIDLYGTKGSPPPGCTCRRWGDSRDPDARPGARRETHDNTEQANEITDRRAQTEATQGAGKAVKSVDTHHPGIGADWGLIAAVAVRWGIQAWRKLRDLF